MCSHVTHCCDCTVQAACSGNCPASSSSPQGSTSINQCLCFAGYASAAVNSLTHLCRSHTTAGSCASCTSGKYKSTVGFAACTSCPSGAASPLASTSQSQCFCPAGTSGNAGGGQSCTACANGYWAAQNSLSCSQCPAGSKRSRPLSLMRGLTTSGYFGNAPGRNSTCTGPCAKGRWSSATATTCAQVSDKSPGNFVMAAVSVRGWKLRKRRRAVCQHLQWKLQSELLLSGSMTRTAIIR